MKIINQSKYPRYVEEIDQTLAPNQRSISIEKWNLSGLLREAISAATPGLVQLSDGERKLIAKVLELDAKAKDWAPVEYKAPDPVKKLMDAERPARTEEVRKIRESLANEEAIRAETTYANRRDVEKAKEAAGKIRGEVVARKLASTGAEEVSLGDLMGDNRFIEEHLKDSRIAMDLSNTEGWKAPADDAPVTEEHVKALEAQLPPDGKEPNPFAPDTTDAPVEAQEAPRRKKGKKNRGDRKAEKADKAPEASPAD